MGSERKRVGKMPNRALAKIALAAALLSCACLASGGLAPANADDPGERAASLAAFARIAPVFQSPRCMNCHTVTDFPRQGDDRHPHIMNVRRGAEDHGSPGLPCSTCHQRANQAASGVPGADEDWHLAPLAMGWEGLSAGELCRHLLDPARNGGRTGAGVLDHLQTNLVRWAWSPGLTRTGAARSTPPMAYEQFLSEAQSWIATGAACP